MLRNATEEQADADTIGPFRRGLENHGYREGRDFVIVPRYGRGDANALPRLAAEIVALAPDLIVAGDAISALAIHTVTATVPIVGYLGSGTDQATFDTLVGNMAMPVGNFTGITTNALSLTGKLCDLALEVIPSATRVGVLVYSLNPDGGRDTRDVVAAAARVRNFTPVIVDAAQPADLVPAFRHLVDQRVDIAVIGSGAVFSSNRARVVQIAADAGLPTVYNEQGYVEVGGLISYGFSRASTFTQLATFADLLLRGARPSDVPVEETATYFMALNLKTAKALALSIPPSLLFRADIVIE